MPISLHKKLSKGSPEHDRLASAVYARFKMAKDAMANRRTKWQKAENLYLAYKPETAQDTEKKRKRDSSGTVEYTTVVLPYSYALLMTAVTYWTSVFLGRSPVNQFTGRHGESHQKVQAVEALIDYQLLMDQMVPKLYCWLLDAGKYGIGVLGNYWTEEYVTYSSIQERPGAVPGTSDTVRQITRSLKYQGNSVFNVRPYDFFPDPRVSTMDFQHGEFCARYVEVPLSRLQASEEGYFNLDAAKDAMGGQAEREEGSSQIEMPDSNKLWSSFSSFKDTDNVPVVEMVMELAPNEWGLGEGGDLEKWVLTMTANSKVLIGCRPQGMAHGAFPFHVITYDMDPYSFTLRGMLEICEPLAHTLDWLFNSHFFNVRKAMNDQLVVDPMRVEMQDLKTGGPGRIIRLRGEAYGTDPMNAVRQLPITDVTQGHLNSVRVVVEMFQRITGVSDQLMGLMNTKGGRTTAAEVRTSTSLGINRMKTFCEYNSSLGWSPLAQMMVQNTQQFMTDPMKLKIAGDLMMGDPKFIDVLPEDITGFYDFVPVDGTLPIDRFAQANLWKEVIQGLGAMPQIAGTYDIAAIFSWMAQLAGLKNITQFKLNVMPDQAAAMAAAQGKLVPIGQGVTGTQRGTRGSASAQTGLGSAGLLPGVQNT